VAGDIAPASDDQQKIDVEHLLFADESFELIICNHVLEHVSDPDLALRELARCLTRDGHLIAQTPYSPKLKSTFEMLTPVSTQFARLFYGQEDHVRLFGADLVSRFHEAGLSGEPLSHQQVLGELDAQEHGCNENEPFFLFERA
jgi:SAM-dependent methyltransferase